MLCQAPEITLGNFESHLLKIEDGTHIISEAPNSNRFLKGTDSGAGKDSTHETPGQSIGSSAL